MKQRNITVALVVVLAFSGNVSSASTQEYTKDPHTEDTVSLTLGQSLNLAMDQSYSLQAMVQAQKVAMHNRKAAWGYRVPRISATASYTYMSQDIGHYDFNGTKDKFAGLLASTGIPQFTDMAMAIKGMDLNYTFQKRDFGLVGVGVAMPLFLGGKINALTGAAKIGELQVEQRTEQAKSELFINVSTAYWSLVLAENLEALALQTRQALDKQYYNAQQLELNGMIARTEVLYAQMNLSKARAAYEAAHDNTRTARATLSSLVHSDEVVKASGTLRLIDSLPELERIQQIIRESNPMLGQIKLGIDMAQQGVRAVRSEFMPQLSVMGGYDIYSYNLSNQIPRWVVGATLSLNIFDGLTREHNFAGAKSRKREIESLEKGAVLDTKIVVDKLYNQMLNARNNAQSEADALVFAQQYLYSTSQAFDEGMGTMSDVIDARLLLSAAKTQVIVQTYQFNILYSQLAALMGYSTMMSEMNLNL